jgi:hypothetical protein
MPLPKTPLNIHFLDKDSSVVENVTFSKRETGYRPTSEFYPTMRAVKCSKCGEIGVCEFLGGLNLKEADRIMDGKPIRGTCLKCGKMVDLVPLPVDEYGNPGLEVYALMQEALLEKVRRGRQLDPTGTIWPVERIRMWERWHDGEQA